MVCATRSYQDHLGSVHYAVGLQCIKCFPQCISAVLEGWVNTFGALLCVIKQFCNVIWGKSLAWLAVVLLAMPCA